ncbi:MarR family transcriptional regulator [Rhodobium orientis]|uniref:MarR family transcriptional regulator n=2 Tax=Rhodobium orientis TaxID=34017 RepID=A0A327JMJ3_9HYPH|nr:MarR family transcriptional regulator [Rhodobium orientis]RAI24638.1 MarR family transcriptional regulator [Rhodobium orientis]
MSSENLENVGWSPRNASERILAALKMHGAETSATLGKKLGITGEAARQQLVRLADQGLVEATSEAKGVGRPKQLWHLTDAAQSRFPDTHANLTTQLLRIIRDQLGEAALDRIITIREAETRACYEAKLADKSDLADRVAALARLRSEEGYMAEWRRQPDGSILFAENHCPICMAATACQGFCRAELEVFRAVLGPSAEIERAEHIVKGGRRCTYVIREKGA